MSLLGVHGNRYNPHSHAIAGLPVHQSGLGVTSAHDWARATHGPRASRFSLNVEKATAVLLTGTQGGRDLAELDQTRFARVQAEIRSAIVDSSTTLDQVALHTAQTFLHMAHTPTDRLLFGDQLKALPTPTEGADASAALAARLHLPLLDFATRCSPHAPSNVSGGVCYDGGRISCNFRGHHCFVPALVERAA